MKNDFAIKYASRLDKEYRKGFTFGLGIVLLGYYNTVDEFIEDEEKQGEFFQKWETEVNRLIQEELHGDITDVAQLIAFHIEDIREKYHLHDPSEDYPT